jgi:hypothetical protein
MLVIFSFSIYSSELLTFVVIGQTDFILFITFIVSYLSFSFVFNGLQFSVNIYEAYSQKILILFLILIFIFYIIYKFNVNIIDRIYCSNDDIVKDKIIDTIQNPNLSLNNSISISDKSVEKIVESASVLLKIKRSYYTCYYSIWNCNCNG